MSWRGNDLCAIGLEWMAQFPLQWLFRPCDPLPLPHLESASSFKIAPLALNSIGGGAMRPAGSGWRPAEFGLRAPLHREAMSGRISRTCVCFSRAGSSTTPIVGAPRTESADPLGADVSCDIQKMTASREIASDYSSCSTPSSLVWTVLLSFPEQLFRARMRPSGRCRVAAFRDHGSMVSHGNQVDSRFWQEMRIAPEA